MKSVGSTPLRRAQHRLGGLPVLCTDGGVPHQLAAGAVMGVVVFMAAMTAIATVIHTPCMLGGVGEKSPELDWRMRAHLPVLANRLPLSRGDVLTL